MSFQITFRIADDNDLAYMEGAEYTLHRPMITEYGDYMVVVDDKSTQFHMVDFASGEPITWSREHTHHIHNRGVDPLHPRYEAMGNVIALLSLAAAMREDKKINERMFALHGFTQIV